MKLLCHEILLEYRAIRTRGKKRRIRSFFYPRISRRIGRSVWRRQRDFFVATWFLPKVHRSTRTATLRPIKSCAERTNVRSRRSSSLARRGMEALKWLDGVSESAGDQRAAVERNSLPGRYTAATSAHVFSGFRLVASIYQARRKPAPPLAPIRGDTTFEQVTRTMHCVSYCFRSFFFINFK